MTTPAGTLDAAVLNSGALSVAGEIAATRWGDGTRDAAVLNSVALSTIGLPLGNVPPDGAAVGSCGFPAINGVDPDKTFLAASRIGRITFPIPPMIGSDFKLFSTREDVGNCGEEIATGLNAAFPVNGVWLFAAVTSGETSGFALVSADAATARDITFA